MIEVNIDSIGACNRAIIKAYQDGYQDGIRYALGGLDKVMRGLSEQIGDEAKDVSGIGHNNPTMEVRK